MERSGRAGSFFDFFRKFSRSSPGRVTLTSVPPPPKIGLALGGGFARGIAHAGLLQVFEKHQIPIYCITGVSAGSIVAAAYASGVSPAEIGRAGCSMRFGDVGSWSLGRMGFVASERMKKFLERLLRAFRFEEMRIPLGVLATDLATGEPVRFHGAGDVVLPIRASCAYPGLFHPIRCDERLLVDGAMSVEVPARLARQLGATHVISVHLPTVRVPLPRNVFQVVNRCFQILSSHTEETWRRESDLVIAPDVGAFEWDGFGCGPDMLRAGETAALDALPHIQEWLRAVPHPRSLSTSKDPSRVSPLTRTTQPGAAETW
jgi:NTE family protein